MQNGIMLQEPLSDLNSFLVSGKILDGITIDANSKTAFFRIESRRTTSDAPEDDTFTIDYFDIKVPPALFGPVSNCAVIGRKVRVVASLSRRNMFGDVTIEPVHIEYRGHYCDECHKEIDPSTAWGNCTACGDDLCAECAKKRGRFAEGGGFDEHGRCGRCAAKGEEAHQ